ncbi:hypothetical protein E2C01_093166 [Portunus trituberculatus]|uniref:Uncharacterized protein n=1 Tax=Portunus trituberculatus TaxID=210409 RepID=A0A5B7JIB5_PORTR|nr:hypothetical protein [Portunus trituberculatus]
MGGMSAGVSKLMSRLNKVVHILAQYKWYSTLHSSIDNVSIGDLSSPSRFDKFRPKLVEGYDSARGEKVAVGSGLGPKAGTGSRSFSSLAASSFTIVIHLQRLALGKGSP